MRSSVTMQDIRNLLNKSKVATAFKNGVKLEDIATNFREFLEMFEVVFSRFENLEEMQRKNKDLERQLKKLHDEIDRVKVGLHNVAQAVKKNGKN